MKNQFIPYELALRLKELGFDEECLGFYVPLLDGTQEFELMKFESQGKKVVLALLWQQAFDWLREKYNLDSYVRKTTYKQWKFQINYLLQDDSEEEWGKYKSYQDYKDTQEEAREACLIKLIELVENEKN